jgi:hypothetical protein
MKFSDVSFRGPIDSSRFLFTPGSLDYRDRTDEFVRSLGQQKDVRFSRCATPNTGRAAHFRTNPHTFSIQIAL